jgi:hypothetical protein
LDRLLSTALAPWRKKTAVHDPAKVVCDLAMTLALGGDCLADIALLRASPASTGRWPRTGRCRARRPTRRRPRPRPRTARAPRARGLALRLDTDRAVSALRWRPGEAEPQTLRKAYVCGRLVDRLTSTVAATI